MLVSEFDYYLPDELIAQTPMEQRDQSRLMIFDVKTNVIKHRLFCDLTSVVRPGDCLVINDTRVFAARFWAKKENGTARVEILLLNRVGGTAQDDQQQWEALLRPARRVPPGTRLLIPGGITAEVLSITPQGGRRLMLTAENLTERLKRYGSIPLPPYIHKPLQQAERYQTVYAKEEGSVAAPTAGLHFTERLLSKLREKGVEIVPLTLHVGLGTFLPVRTETVEEHVMHSEPYHIPEHTARVINNTRRQGDRIIAVGTTVTRALESAVSDNGQVTPGDGETNLFIFPGYRFRVVNALLTNFHLPRSTLLMLVAAYAGRSRIMAAYREAIRCRYRFFSFGDAMLLLGGGADGHPL